MNAASRTIFGTDEPPAERRTVTVGPVDFTLVDGEVAHVRFRGVEAVRRISHPIRDESWGTAPLATVREDETSEPGRFAYERAFATADGALAGVFRLNVAAGEGGSAELRAEVAMEAARETRVNRAGFTLLHPLDGVVGTPLMVRRPDGGEEAIRFPEVIAPAQPALGIAGLAHTVHGIAVAIAFEGEIFEMEDQRNWSDASYKTYCRPLSAPRPFTIAAGERIVQRIAVTLSGEPRRTERATTPERARTHESRRLPEILVAAEPDAFGSAGALLAECPVLLRVRADVDPHVLEPYAGRAVDLEIVLSEGAARDFTPTADACRRAGLVPRRVVALPQAYLASCQPQGPWPAGPRPADLIAPVREAFPGVVVGTGVLTNFTELNRCPPDAATADYVTFGSCAIVHAADDVHVVETLEALPDILESAAGLARGRPLRLGLVSIGMRSNPYGAAVAPNPEGRRVPMAMADPRGSALFGAAWAVGVLAACAGRAEALALCMEAGPLAAGEGGRAHPLFHVVRAAQALAGSDATVRRTGGLVSIRLADGRGLAANLGSEPVDLPEPAHVLDAATAEAGGDRLPSDPDGPGGRTLEPFAVALFGRSE